MIYDESKETVIFYKKESNNQKLINMKTLKLTNDIIIDKLIKFIIFNPVLTTVHFYIIINTPIYLTIFGLFDFSCNLCVVVLVAIVLILANLIVSAILSDTILEDFCDDYYEEYYSYDDYTKYQYLYKLKLENREVWS